MKNSLKKLKDDALCIYKKTIEKIQPDFAIKRMLRVNQGFIEAGGQHSEGVCRFSTDSIDNIYIFSIGKAAYTMALSAVEILQPVKDKLSGGVVITKEGHAGGENLTPLQVREASHPIPDIRSLEASEEILRTAQQAGERDLILFLISGGGSALYEMLPAGVSLSCLQSLTKELLYCGAAIEEINILRKKISLVKGGKTALAAYPARCVSLILSDVLGSPISSIASGPTYPDDSTFSQALGVIQKYRIEKKIPHSIWNYITEEAEKELNAAKSKTSDKFEHCFWHIIGDNNLMTKEAEKSALSLGYNSIILSSQLQGEARYLGGFFADIAKQAEFDKDFFLPGPCCIIAGGEPVVTVRGKGKGGRCQEAALGFAAAAGNLRQSVFLACGSDGTDGPNDAAGGITDPFTKAKGLEIELDINSFLEDNNSYEYLKAVKDLVITGPTGTNVNDLFLLLCGKA